MEEMKKDPSLTLEMKTTLSEGKNTFGGINKRLYSSEKNQNFKAKQQKLSKMKQGNLKKPKKLTGISELWDNVG